MQSNILLSRIINLRQLILCQPQILIRKSNRNTSNLVVVLIQYNLVLFHIHFSYRHGYTAKLSKVPTISKIRSHNLYSTTIIIILHQTTTVSRRRLRIWGCNSFYFYIKPQHVIDDGVEFVSCNSFYFYIKPQHSVDVYTGQSVVIHSISTSNHNLSFLWPSRAAVVIHSISTSNHNSLAAVSDFSNVVIHSISTSNHNLLSLLRSMQWL